MSNHFTVLYDNKNTGLTGEPLVQVIYPDRHIVFKDGITVEELKTVVQMLIIQLEQERA